MLKGAVVVGLAVGDASSAEVMLVVVVVVVVVVDVGTCTVDLDGDCRASKADNCEDDGNGDGKVQADEVAVEVDVLGMVEDT